LFSKQPKQIEQPGPAQLAMVQTIAKMIGVPPAVLAKAFYTIATAGDRLERLEAKIDALIAQRSYGNGVDLGGAGPQSANGAGTGDDRSDANRLAAPGEHD